MTTRTPEDDFNRNVWCLLGLPFDGVDLESASAQIFKRSEQKKQCVISTPNLNFVVSALGEKEFRESVISSDLCLMDGMPLLWVSRMLGLGITEKVSGSDLFDYIRVSNQFRSEEFSVFFFGGEDNAAEQACHEVNQDDTGFSCAGYLNPGFGSVESLSNEEIIAEINLSQADFLILALGAKKGQSWIERNRQNIKIPVISHLGAVVNFAAERVKRAPRWMQTAGMEWMWRIYQEPVLWRRYLSDGYVFLELLLFRIIPNFIWNQMNRSRLAKGGSADGQMSEKSDGLVISIDGDCLQENLAPIREIFARALKLNNNIEVDLSGVSSIDGAFLGLCQMLYKHTHCAGGQLSFSGLSPVHRRLFYWNCADYML